MRAGEYRDAMESFHLAANRTYYSRALKQYRRDTLNHNFGWIALGLTVILGVLVIRFLVKRRRPVIVSQEVTPNSWGGRQLAGLDFAFTCLTRPFKGFHSLKYERQGSLPVAIFLFALFVVTMTAKTLQSGFLIRTTSPEEVNLLTTAASACLPVLLFCVANWCVTTLMEGEGTFSQIFMAASYALLPMILMQLPLILLSNFLVVEELGLYYALETTVVLYTIALVLIGNMSVHNFSMSRTVAMTILTCIGMAVIVFLLFLLVNLAFEVFGFGWALYREILFR